MLSVTCLLPSIPSDFFSLGVFDTSLFHSAQPGGRCRMPSQNFSLPNFRRATDFIPHSHDPSSSSMIGASDMTTIQARYNNDYHGKAWRDGVVRWHTNKLGQLHEWRSDGQGFRGMSKHWWQRCVFVFSLLTLLHHTRRFGGSYFRFIGRRVFGWPGSTGLRHFQHGVVGHVLSLHLIISWT
jgi:hypothetical protein